MYRVFGQSQPSRTWLRKMRKLSLCAALTFPALAMADGVTWLVGADSACDTNSSGVRLTLQQAIDAAKSVPGPDTIRVAYNQSYSQQALQLQGDELTLLGGYASCSSTTPDSRTTLSGAGGTARSVIQIRGDGRWKMDGFNITQGDEGDNDDGGGIDFKGSGPLEISNSGIVNNKAGLGGGIYVESSGGQAIIELKHDTLVAFNRSAHDGGGVYLKDDVVLYMTEANGSIYSNTAVGNGGGLMLRGGAEAHIGSAGTPLSGTIASNEAKNGGGVGIFEGDVNVSSTAPPSLVRIENNTASNRGGAVWMAGENSPSTSNSSIHLKDAVISGNKASDGGVFYLDSDESDTFQFPSYSYVQLDPCGFQYLPCVDISGNTSGNSDGALIYLHGNSFVAMSRANIHHNSASSIFRLRSFGSSEDSAYLQLADSLVHNNTVLTSLVKLDEAEDFVRISSVTFADNSVSGASAISAENSSSTIELKRSIIHQPGKLTVSHPGGPTTSRLDAVENLSTEIGSLTPDNSNAVAPPRFVDPEHGDYRVQAASLAVDYGGNVGGPRDVEGFIRGVDLLGKLNFNGTRDLGAYERQDIGNLILNPSFAADNRIWVQSSQQVVWSPFDSSGGTQPGSGSVEVNIPGPTNLQSVIVLTQCVHLPGPGTYKLTAKGFGGSISPLAQDPKFVVSTFRHDSDDCTGTYDATSQLPIRTGNGWQSTTNPLVLLVPESQFTLNSTVEVSLLINRNVNDTGTNGLFGRFDDVSLTYEPNNVDKIFANGFQSP